MGSPLSFEYRREELGIIGSKIRDDDVANSYLGERDCLADCLTDSNYSLACLSVHWDTFSQLGNDHVSLLWKYSQNTQIELFQEKEFLYELILVSLLSINNFNLRFAPPLEITRVNGCATQTHTHAHISTLFTILQPPSPSLSYLCRSIPSAYLPLYCSSFHI